MTRTSYIQ